MIAGILSICLAQVFCEEVIIPKKFRGEVYVSYDRLSPNDVYGDRKNITFNVFDVYSKTLTFYGEAASFSWKEGDAAMAGAGAYKDWAERLYTFSSISAGTNSSYLQEYRLDNDFNIKLGAQKNIVFTVGGSYIKYFDVHSDFPLSSGMTLYLGKLICGFRYFMNTSNSGSVISYSQLYDLAYGAEGINWAFLTVSLGSQAYLATYVEPPQGVAGNISTIALKDRKWLGKGFGISGELNYLKLDNGYDKYGLILGGFREF